MNKCKTCGVKIHEHGYDKNFPYFNYCAEEDLVDSYLDKERDENWEMTHYA